MPDQRAAMVLAALKRESAMGVEATGGAGATQIRLIDSQGLELTRGLLESQERRRDQLRHMGRLSGHDVGGTYNCEASVGGATDLLAESILRSAWSSPITGAVDITTTPSTIVRAAGSWLTDGYRVGDVVTLAGDTDTANNAKRALAVSVTATTITTLGQTWTTNAVPRSVTVSRLKKVSTPTGSTALTDYSYTVEQQDLDIDEGELFRGVRNTAFAMALRPRAMSTFTHTFMGLTSRALSTAESPYFTNPSLTTSDPLEADSAYIFYKGTQILKATALDINLSIDAAPQPVIGSWVNSDVYTNRLNLTGALQAIRTDLVALSDYLGETEFDIGGILREPTGSPPGTFAFYAPRVKIARLTVPFVGGDGAKVETRELLFGPHPGDADTEAAAIHFFSSAA